MEENIALQGQWKEFIFKTVSEQDYPAIVEHLQENFHHDEPIHKLADLPKDDNYRDFSINRVIWKLGSCHDTCFMAIHQPSGKLAGLQFSLKWDKNETEQDVFGPPKSATKLVPPPFKRIHDLTHAPLINTRKELFEKLDIPFAGFNFLVSTSAEFRHQGLAGEMLRRMLELLKTKGYPLIFTYYSNPFSRRCAEREGFAEIGRVQLGSVKNEVGELVLPHATANDYVTLMALRLIKRASFSN